jgi:hypothetical protein
MRALPPQLPRERHLRSEQRRAPEVLATGGCTAAPGQHCLVMDSVLIRWPT